MKISITWSVRFLVCIAAALMLLGAQALAQPISATGWNRDVVVENTAATPYSSAAAPFDVPNNYAFYQGGLSTGTRGLPSTGSFTSLVDGTTLFQFQPYTANNALQLSESSGSFGTLTLTTSQAYNSLSILAAAANSGTSQGNLVIHFTDASVSPALQFNNSDWFFQPNPAIKGFGRINLGAAAAEDNGNDFPELYQTTLNLSALGFSTKPIASIDFLDLSSDPRESTAIFALSGTPVPEPTSLGLLSAATALLTSLQSMKRRR